MAGCVACVQKLSFYENLSNGWIGHFALTRPNMLLPNYPMMINIFEHSIYHIASFGAFHD